MKFHLNDSPSSPAALSGTQGKQPFAANAQAISIDKHPLPRTGID